MKHNRREFLRTSVAAAGSLAAQRSEGAGQKPTPSPAFPGKRLGSIFNNDADNILWNSSGGNTTSEEYQRAVHAILDLRPGLLAQDVGHPEAVIYRSSVATTFDKYHAEVYRAVLRKLKEEDAVPPERIDRPSEAMRKLLDLGTDPLALTIEACRKRGIPIVASYRMNAEDFYEFETQLSDFERGHPEWKIPGANCLDPAAPQVYDHRMKIFTEVAERYEIDGIEFDFRRWYHMVSDPLNNHTVLTRMVRDTRKMLEETARKKERKKLILGARVGPSLDTDPSPFVYPGIYNPNKPRNASCKDLGLDVETWIAEELVEYLCPALFLDGLPSLPKTREFVALAKRTRTGIYPTLWGWSLWAHGICEKTINLDKKDEQALALFKDELCTTALRMYEDGADGISTFNWYVHIRNARMPGAGPPAEGEVGGLGVEAVQTYIYPLLKDPAAIRSYRDEPCGVPPRG